MGTCPAIDGYDDGAMYANRVSTVARWADEDGWEALLVTTDHRRADPWLISALVIASTERLSPIVAVQPLDAHPFTVARIIASLGFLHRRRVFINFVAGGSPRELDALGDATPHDRRYDRVVEYGSIIRQLLSQRTPVVYDGEYYKLNALSIYPLESDLAPVFTISGSSSAGMAAARELNARAFRYLGPSGGYTPSSFDPSVEHGTRLGIIVRDSSGEAWKAAKERFPENAKGRILRQFASSISDSVWVKELDRAVECEEFGVYWLGPYKHFNAICPYLVGSRDEVALKLAEYMNLGITTFLIDTPESAEDSKRITSVFAMAQQKVERLSTEASF